MGDAVTEVPFILLFLPCSTFILSTHVTFIVMGLGHSPKLLWVFLITELYSTGISRELACLFIYQFVWGLFKKRYIASPPL